MAITLIGYRGCGKSSVAPRLAEALGWSWVDTDHIIEQRAGNSIRKIFESEGESGFRQREADVVKDLCTSGELVIAAGGGAILSETNRHRMKSAGPVVWLQVSVDVLAARIAGDSTSAARRPSLTGRSITEEVADVLAAREEFYRAAATIVMDATRLPPDAIAQEIVRALAANPHNAQSSWPTASQETPE